MIEDLTKPDMLPVKEDRFIRAYTHQVEKMLAQAGKYEIYSVQIGEYESRTEIEIVLK